MSSQSAASSVDSLAGKGSIGTLGAPGLAGRPMAPTTSADNDLAIQTLEKKLRCSCGCGLDIYTCRTTDFTCTYSPELHREIMKLWDGGQTADQIIATFVQEYGEKALMAPPPRGFNLAGYLVPGVLILMLGAVLAWVLLRRRAIVAPAEAPPPAPVDATGDELAELEREIAESDRG
ncbi:MAG TPA: cytochrome c-type biogenesis protein CcmH [Gemmatimonadales bacterium]|nr:cytochrome c-type biogenesis protein CcmH [Gemmatimonadales bacterium]